jgi:hypothetical protein
MVWALCSCSLAVGSSRRIPVLLGFGPDLDGKLANRLVKCALCGSPRPGCRKSVTLLFSVGSVRICYLLFV